VERIAHDLFAKIGVHAPFLGLLLALAGVYVLGLLVRSIVGRFLITWVDRILLRIPLLRDAYEAWKHVSVTPGGKEGVFAKAALVGSGEGGRVLGFTSGEPVAGDPNTLCVFVPNAPNPINGRLYFVPRGSCVILEGVGMEEAFKSLLSTGNYVPPGLGAATAKAGAALPTARTEGFVRT
jgi:uncharacterized membrane protein